MALNADRLGAALQAAEEGALGDSAPGFRQWLAGLGPEQLNMRTAIYKAQAQAIINELQNHAVVTVTGVSTGAAVSGPGTVE